MPTINQISNLDEIKSSRPNQPVASFLQEAENLYVWCVDDISELIEAGVDEDLVNQLPENIKACREAQTIWQKKLKTPGDAQVQWKLQLPEAIKLRTELLQSMRFAFRNKSNLSGRLKYIAKGKKYANIIQDLNDLAVLGRVNSQLLIAIGFDLDLFDTATAKSEELADLWAQSKSEKNHLHETAVLRNKAFWTLHKQVTEIRTTGQFIFRDRNDRYIGYVSQFWRQKNNRRGTPTQ